ncbi:MAG: YgiQ family radical SAM protein [Bacteroidales bacterium]|nr:YgiQ family radical SAM protein [Bacteroidales bacterium]
MPFLPTTKKEVEARGWDILDVIIISGDAYVDHPSFGPAVIGRWLEKLGLRVAIVPQPNWQDDGRDFAKLGKPRLFFGITAGNMDSMVNHYTATRRLRHDDAYTPGGQHGFRPDYATVVYSRWVRHFFPDTPIVIGGIEASLRRLSHYDYWSDSLKPSILMECPADVLVYGMGERPMTDLVRIFQQDDWKSHLHECRQIAFVTNRPADYCDKSEALVLHPFEKELSNKRFYGENFVAFETESNKKTQRVIIQPYNRKSLLMMPPYPPATEEEMDSYALFDVMMNAPHPKYAKRGSIPAWEMIQNSITIHRGCFGGCSFCAITAHQGRFISSRSEKSILAEVAHLAQRPYFKGHVTDLGAPSANMYRMHGKNESACAQCARPSCIYPQICPNLITDHKPLLQLYRKASAIGGVKRITIGSGIRYDLLLADDRADHENGLTDYLSDVVRHHVSGRLKVAPEHTEDKVLKRMRKPSFNHFLAFNRRFQKLNREAGLKLQLVPYFISAHPGCTLDDMKALHKATAHQHLHIEQVQDFTPTPMTYSTAMYFLGYDPYTGEKVFSAKGKREKDQQKSQFFPSHPSK